MANDTAKSILMQVAMKGAINMLGSVGTIDLIKTTTQELYAALVELHESNDIAIKDKSNFPAKGAAAKPAASSEDAPVVTIEGDEYFDYREAKAAGTKPERWPDFKKVGDKTNKGSEWLIDKDGTTPTPFAKLVAKAGV